MQHRSNVPGRFNEWLEKHTGQFVPGRSRTDMERNNPPSIRTTLPPVSVERDAPVPASLPRQRRYHWWAGIAIVAGLSIGIALLCKL